MKLDRILEGVDYTLINGTLDKNINSLNYDSRKIGENCLFICISGFQVDGHNYVEQAIKKGATAILVEKDVEILNNDIAVIKVKNTRKAMALIASNFYNNPSNSFNLIGITGTNGKTTTSFIVEYILKYHGEKVGLVGTNEIHIDKKIIESQRTTPEAIDLQKIFTEARDGGVDSMVMEVSSHALELYRVYSNKYEVAVFTNLTLDHLDYHETMENYLEAKSKLFKMSKYGIINLDDEASKYLMDTATCEKIFTYSTEDKNAHFFAKNIKLLASGVNFTVVIDGKEHNVEFGIPGKFNVYNSLAAIGACSVLGVPMTTIIAALSAMKGVKGRFETIMAPQGYSVIVDYAHAPDGLLNVLKSIKEFCTGKVITVFGCGGDRDKSKRPIMGKIAGDYSDFCVITSDNPRTEDPDRILDDIEEGIQDTMCPYAKILDRKEGIRFGLTMAEENDVVLIAGKGHEDYQIIGHEKIHFDDVEIIQEFIQGEKN